MRTRIIFCLFLILQVLTVQSQEFNWATSVSGEEYEYGTKAIKDNSGNTYIIGYSTGNPIVYEGVSYSTNGRSDAFFAKLNINRELIWMKLVGGNDANYYDYALDMHMDPFGDIYLTFQSSGNNFKYDGQTLSGINSPGQYSGEGVLIKVNSNGDYMWHDSGTISSGFGAVATDAIGNVYLTGNFTRNITLGGTITLTNPSTATTTDLFVAKYQPDGSIVWAKHAGGMPHNTFAYGYDIEVNAQTNEVVVLGRGDGAVLFDGIPMPVINGSDEGILLVSYAATDGTISGVQRILNLQNNGYAYGTSLDISASGIMGVCGYTLGGSSGLVGFYASDGSIITEHTYPSGNSIRLNSITFNEYDDAYISGKCTFNTVLGISPGTLSITGPTGFIVKMDSLQQVKWVSEFEASQFANRVNYDNGQLLYAGRIDNNFTYNYGQEVITNDAGDGVFAEMIDLELPFNGSNITGTIFQDLDNNCALDVGDVVQKAVLVRATGGDGRNHYSISDVNGDYNIRVDVGAYTVEVLPNPIQIPMIEQSCYTQQNVTLNTLGQDANNIDFPLELAECALLHVDLSSDRRRRCFESNTYVTYGNSGFADAENVEVTVQFPEYVTVISSDYSYTIDAQGNYVFGIGTLGANESGIIHIIDFTECIEGITGLTQCTEAWITPVNECVIALDPDYAEWDKSMIALQGTCIDDTTVQFTIINTAELGEGDMQNPNEYRIYVDNALAETGMFQLEASESMLVNYPANGQTIRLEADQHPMLPWDSHPENTIEGCGGGSGDERSIGFVNTMPTDDNAVDVEIHCLPIIDSYDPNDKLVSPTGITENHYVKAGTILDYMIRFQNTGTDTAYTVVVKDTLSEYLDPSTIRWGGSSHPYSINITGTDRPVLEFRFDNINLPDSTANELGSHGFVKFKATTYETLANDIDVDNKANIYFDFNLPIRTNTAQVTISDFVLIYDPLSVETHLVDEISVYPNPTSGHLVIETKNLQQVQIYNVSGILIETTNRNEIDLSRYSKGIYLVKIWTDKGTTVKKIVLK